MQVFNNQQQSGYEEIVAYSPKYYQQIKEMDAVFQFAGWTLDHMAASLEKLIESQFIAYMDETEIAVLENFYEKVPMGTLEDRRRYLLSLDTVDGKISVSKMETDIKSLLGNGSEVNVTIGEVVEININTMDDTDKTYTLVKDYIERVMQAQLVYDLIYEKPMIAQWYQGIIWQDDEVFTLRQVEL